MSVQPDAHTTATASAAVLKDRIDELRRALFGEQSRLKRRREDVKRMGDLEVRLQTESLSPVDRKSLNGVLASLRRGIERSRLVDGSDEALAQRSASQETAIADLEQQWREVKARAAVAALAKPVGAADADREQERAQRARRQRLMSTLGMTERQVDALQGPGTGTPAPLDDSDLSDGALRARFTRLSERLERQIPELRKSRWRIGSHVAALEQELRHWSRPRDADPSTEFEALSRHLHHEMQRFVQLLDAQVATRFEQALQYLDESAISRFNETDAEPEPDPAYEQISFRAEDIRLLSDLAAALVEPLLQAQGRLLPARSMLAGASFRSQANWLQSLGAPLAVLTERPELQVPAVPAALISQMVRGAVQLGSVAPLAPRSEVTPLRRLRRGDVFGAVTSLLVRAARYPAKLIQPLGMLSLIGVVAIAKIKGYLQSLDKTHIAMGFAVLLVMTYRSWTQEARLGELELLKKGKAMLRELLVRELDALRQTWKRLLTEHCDRFIDHTMAELKGRVANTSSDEARVQRECKRIETELRDRAAEQRRLHDACAQAARLLGENLVVLRTAIEAEMSATQPVHTP